MDDKELLRLAAKAMGFEKTDIHDGDVLEFRYGYAMAIWTGQDYWNPLEDEGDCTRMETALGLSSDWKTKACVVYRVRMLFAEDVFQGNDGDKNRARRRASTRAAAEIGRAMS